MACDTPKATVEKQIHSVTVVLKFHEVAELRKKSSKKSPYDINNEKGYEILL